LKLESQLDFLDLLKKSGVHYTELPEREKVLKSIRKLKARRLDEIKRIDGLERRLKNE
jgi:hypothetical protein